MPFVFYFTKMEYGVYLFLDQNITTYQIPISKWVGKIIAIVSE
jgi:hypothetical protein